MPTPLNTATFVDTAKAVHGTKYDYSHVVYVNSKTKVRIVCPEHGEFLQTPADHIHNKSGCPICAGNAELTLDRFLADAKSTHGGRYDYGCVKLQGNSTPVEIICPTHGSFWQSPKQHRKGRGCPECGGTKQLTLDEVLQRFYAAHGSRYDYSKVVYQNARTPVTIVCPAHGAFTQQASVHMNGHGCPKCAKESLAAQFKGDPESFRAKLRAGYAADLTQYSNRKALVPVVCDRGHKFAQVPADFHRYGCPVCAGRYSRGEQEVRAFIESLGVQCVKQRVGGKEIDLWCPDYNVGFEFNGLYWHSDAPEVAVNTNPKWRHSEKSKAVQSAGGWLVHIWEDMWRDQRAAAQNLICAHLGKLPTIGARTCSVRVVPKAEAKTFLETYHVHGWVPANYLGLYQGGTLVACLGMAPQRSARGAAQGGVWELVRYAASCRVQGGGSKLFSAWCKQMAMQGVLWSRVVTYCDLSMFRGDLYVAMGFEPTAVSGPDYKIMKAGKNARRLHKSNVQKSRLKVLLGSRYVEGKTEAELCAENHIFRIWDCGKARYEFAYAHQ